MYHLPPDPTRMSAAAAQNPFVAAMAGASDVTGSGGAPPSLYPAPPLTPLPPLTKLSDGTTYPPTPGTLTPLTPRDAGTGAPLDLSGRRDGPQPLDLSAKPPSSLYHTRDIMSLNSAYGVPASRLGQELTQLGRYPASYSTTAGLYPPGASHLSSGLRLSGGEAGLLSSYSSRPVLPGLSSAMDKARGSALGALDPSLYSQHSVLGSYPVGLSQDERARLYPSGRDAAAGLAGYQYGLYPPHMARLYPDMSGKSAAPPSPLVQRCSPDSTTSPDTAEPKGVSSSISHMAKCVESLNRPRSGAPPSSYNAAASNSHLQTAESKMTSAAAGLQPKSAAGSASSGQFLKPLPPPRSVRPATDRSDSKSALAAAERSRSASQTKQDGVAALSPAATADLPRPSGSMVPGSGGGGTPVAMVAPNSAAVVKVEDSDRARVSGRASAFSIESLTSDVNKYVAAEKTPVAILPAPAATAVVVGRESKSAAIISHAVQFPPPASAVKPFPKPLLPAVAVDNCLLVPKIEVKKERPSPMKPSKKAKALLQSGEFKTPLPPPRQESAPRRPITPPSGYALQLLEESFGAKDDLKSLKSDLAKATYEFDEQSFTVEFHKKAKRRDDSDRHRLKRKYSRKKADSDDDKRDSAKKDKDHTKIKGKRRSSEVSKQDGSEADDESDEAAAAGEEISPGSKKPIKKKKKLVYDEDTDEYEEDEEQITAVTKKRGRKRQIEYSSGDGGDRAEVDSDSHNSRKRSCKQNKRSRGRHKDGDDDGSEKRSRRRESKQAKKDLKKQKRLRNRVKGKCKYDEGENAFKVEMLPTRTRTQTAVVEGKNRRNRYNRNAAYEAELRKEQYRRLHQRSKRTRNQTRGGASDSGSEVEIDPDWLANVQDFFSDAEGDMTMSSTSSSSDSDDTSDTDATSVSTPTPACTDSSETEETKSSDDEEEKLSKKRANSDTETSLVDKEEKKPRVKVAVKVKAKPAAATVAEHDTKSVTPKKDKSATPNKRTPAKKSAPKRTTSKSRRNEEKSDYEDEAPKMTDEEDNARDDASTVTTASSKSSTLPTGAERVMTPYTPKTSLLKRPNLSISREIGETILHRAARTGHRDVIEWYMENDTVDINAKDNAGYSALHEACGHGDLDVCRMLIGYGADINLSSQKGERPFHDAVAADYVEVVRLLLSLGVDPTTGTYAGKSPLLLAHSRKMKQLLNGYMVDLNGVRKAKEREIPWQFDPYPVKDKFAKKSKSKTRSRRKEDRAKATRKDKLKAEAKAEQQLQDGDDSSTKDATTEASEVDEDFAGHQQGFDIFNDFDLPVEDDQKPLEGSLDLSFEFDFCEQQPLPIYNLYVEAADNVGCSHRNYCLLDDVTRRLFDDVSDETRKKTRSGLTVVSVSEAKIKGFGEGRSGASCSPMARRTGNGDDVTQENSLVELVELNDVLKDRLDIETETLTGVVERVLPPPPPPTPPPADPAPPPPPAETVTLESASGGAKACCVSCGAPLPRQPEDSKARCSKCASSVHPPGAAMTSHHISPSSSLSRLPPPLLSASQRDAKPPPVIKTELKQEEVGVVRPQLCSPNGLLSPHLRSPGIPRPLPRSSSPLDFPRMQMSSTQQYLDYMNRNSLARAYPGTPQAYPPSALPGSSPYPAAAGLSTDLYYQSLRSQSGGFMEHYINFLQSPPVPQNPRLSSPGTYPPPHTPSSNGGF